MNETIPEEARVLVVAADPLARAGIAGLLVGAPGLLPVGAVAANDALGGVLSRTAPHVVVWDLGVNGGGETAFDPALPTLVLTDSAAEARLALDRGARGALSRRFEPARLAAALRAIVAGLLVVDHPIAALAERPPPRVTTTLSPRETEALELLAEGLSNKEIGVALGISEHTARFHVNAILDHLGARSRTEAVVLALREGLITL